MPNTVRSLERLLESSSHFLSRLHAARPERNAPSFLFSLMPFRFRLALSSFFLTLSAATVCAASAPQLVLAPESERAPQTSQVPALDRAVTDFAGLASGSYYWPEGLLAEQLIAGLASRRHRQQQALPGGKRVLSSYRLPNGGSERSALLVDDSTGKVLAAALAHRECGVKSSSTGCRDDQHAVLSIFLRPGIDRAQAQPLVDWSRTVPKEDLDSGKEEKFEKTEYTTMDAAHTKARPVTRPKGFSQDVPLYPRAVLHYTGQDALSDAKARRVLRLQTVDTVEQVLAFYKKLSPPLEGIQSEADERSGYVLGSLKGIAFSVNAKVPRDMPAITNIEIEIAE